MNTRLHTASVRKTIEDVKWRMFVYKVCEPMLLMLMLVKKNIFEHHHIGKEIRENWTGSKGHEEVNNCKTITYGMSHSYVWKSKSFELILKFHKEVEVNKLKI